MSLKTTNKGVAWLYNEVCALLDIWADQEIQQQLAGRLHNMCIYDKISKRLADLGIHRTGEQCREKIKKLRRDYKTVVDNNYSPAFARKMLGCYDKVHEIFGKCTVVKPSFVIESIVYNETLLQSKISVETNESSSQTKDYPVSQFETRLDTPEQKVKSESSDSSSPPNSYTKKNPTNFTNVFEAIKAKSYSKQKTDWNTFKARMEKRLKKQKFLHNKLLRRQTVLHNRFIELEKKKYTNEMEQEQKKLSLLEIQRQKHNEQEINIFKSLLQMMAEKQGIKLYF